MLGSAKGKQFLEKNKIARAGKIVIIDTNAKATVNINQTISKIAEIVILKI